MEFAESSSEDADVGQKSVHADPNTFKKYCVLSVAEKEYTIAENGNSAETGDDGNVLPAFILMALSILVSGIAAFRIIQTKHTIN